MLRRFLTVSASCAALACLGGVLTAPAHAAGGTVTVFNWADYFAPSAFSDFQKATGIKANLSVYDSEEMMDAKIMAGNTGYDVVVANAEPYIATEVQAGAYQVLDRSKIPNWKNLDPELMGLLAKADPGNQHAVIYDWGTVGLGYNVALVKKYLPNAPTDSWALLFDPKSAQALQKCGINIIDSSAIMTPIALKYLGLDPDSQNPADLKKVETLLKGIRPYMKTISQTTWLADLATGNLCLSVGWNGDVLQASKRATAAKNGVTINYLLPKEGSIIWFDSYAMPMNAPNADNGYAFINYMLSPEAGANNSNYTNYANGVLASKATMRPDLVNDPRVFPSKDDLSHLFLQTPVTPKYERIRTRTWDAFKNAS
ncbi:extracellular solute-binding protein [Acidisoma cladoniae]|jgi:putrescine transport system substrate-binding protein|uniref:extracellular solute-binding protein n=1 Tax=Acidisoma cladoniae TaxID=3040935 RepID=UPI00254E2A36|nr:extracellular solute-binding protein [Acidisoma sp. PAMC 29798]